METDTGATTNLSTFYIVRHGETVWNVQGILQGHADSPLTPKGEEQAITLGKKLQHIHFDVVFSSDSLRAKRTAEIVTLERQLAVITTRLLRERAFGKWEGKPYSVFSEELKHLLNTFISLTDEEKKKFKYPDMESDEEVVTRCLTFIRETAVAYANKTILVATHGGLMRALLIHLGFGTYDSLPPGAVQNSAYIKLQSDGVDFWVEETADIEKIEEGS